MERNQSLFDRSAYCRPAAVGAGVAPAWRCQRQLDRTIYSGEFVIFDPAGNLLFSLPGRVVEWNKFATDVYLYNPPMELRRLPEGPCWQLINRDGWFKLHWQRPARSFEESLAYVEDMLNQIPRRILYRLRGESAGTGK